MDQSDLSSRAIMGMYFARMEQSAGPAWLDLVSNLFQSDQASETYKFLGFSPAMREWIAGRQAKGFTTNGLTIANKHWESTIEIAVKDARRDKTGQIVARLDELYERVQSHWSSLLSTLLLNGATGLCYDGQFFFDTDHTEGENTTNQSNKIDVDISALPGAGSDNTVSNPNVAQAQQAVMQGVSAIANFKDDQNEPLNEGASTFLVMVPPGLYTPIAAALWPAATIALQQNVNPNIQSRFRIDVESNARLSSWTDKFVVFRTDSGMKALIRQEEMAPAIKAKAEGSEFEFDNDAWQFGVDTWRNVGYGYWQRACLVTMI